MDLQSPLTQQSRPDVFEHKIVTLYRELFRDVDDSEHTDGFWRELFLLRPDVPRLGQILEDTDTDYLLHIPHQPRQLLIEALTAVRNGDAPADDNALDTLTVFFSVLLGKRYTNPSSDIIDVLAGLDNVDAVFSDLVSTLESAIRAGRTVATQQKAVRASIAVVAGGYQTALVSYFLQRDFFPALMKLIRTLEDPSQALEPTLFAGLLANYDKFEVSNQYRVRFADFVDDVAMERMIKSIGWNCALLRDKYIAILDDTPATWSLGGTLSYVGLGALAGAKRAPPMISEEEQKNIFAQQPESQAAVLLTLYDFNLANKLFRQQFITATAEEKGASPPFSTFLSFSSYLFQHAFRSTRASLYAYITNLILLILIEDSANAKLLCDTSASVRLCRQRPPYLPLPSKPERPYAATLLDILVDGINHNLRKRLDTTLYQQNVVVLSRLLNHLAKTHTKLNYHWSELWRSLLSFVRFLTTYADDLKPLSGTTDLVQHLVDLLTLTLTTGESFLSDSASYDDLFYKLVESGEALTKLRSAYGLGKAGEQSSINTLIGVSKHYRELIDEHHKGKSPNLSPREVSKLIKMGYETLSIEAREELEIGEKFREASWKAVLKKVARVAVADASALVT